MKYHRLISTAVMLLLLATTLPAFGQKEEEKSEAKPQAAQKAQPQQHAQKAQPQAKAQPQHAAQAKAQPQHAAQAKAQPQRAQQAQHQAQPQRAQQAQRQAQPSRGQQPQAVANNRGNSGGHYGRISDVSYNAHFGQGHSFHMGRPQMSGGFNRFQYGGYSFGYNQGWPVGWGYNDPFYVVYIDGAYYLCDISFPGIQLSLNIF
jgi:hypothetical protein